MILAGRCYGQQAAGYITFASYPPDSSHSVHHLYMHEQVQSLISSICRFCLRLYGIELGKIPSAYRHELERNLTKSRGKHVMMDQTSEMASSDNILTACAHNSGLSEFSVNSLYIGRASLN